jgi:hypothetical protein
MRSTKGAIGMPKRKKSKEKDAKPVRAKRTRYDVVYLERGPKERPLPVFMANQNVEGQMKEIPDGVRGDRYPEIPKWATHSLALEADAAFIIIWLMKRAKHTKRT